MKKKRYFFGRDIVSFSSFSQARRRNICLAMGFKFTVKPIHKAYTGKAHNMILSPTHGQTLNETIRDQGDAVKCG